MEHGSGVSRGRDGGLGAAIAVAREAWPAIELPSHAFEEFIRRRSIDANVSVEILQDLFLACACGAGDANGLQCFRERFFGVVGQAVRGLDDSPQFAEEVYQRLSESLFVSGPGREAKIARYRGEGPLAGFVRTSARRIGLRL